MDAQFQIRQNAMEMQSYMKELFDWESDMKKKEKKLLKEQLSANGSDPLAPAPAVRGRADSQVGDAPANLQKPAAKTASQQKTKRKSKKQTSKTPASHTWTHYNKWDKFDVDAALNSSSESDADSEPEPEAEKLPYMLQQQGDAAGEV